MQRKCTKSAPNIFSKTETNAYNLKIQHNFEVRSLKTVHYWSESISYFGPKIWNIFQASIKKSNSLNSLKKLINKCQLKHVPADCVRATYLAWLCWKLTIAHVFYYFFNDFLCTPIFAQTGQNWVFVFFNVLILRCNCATVELD